MVTLPLFIYGSLRDPQVRARLFGPRADLSTCPAWLPGYVRQVVPSFGYPFLALVEGDAAGAAARVDGELLRGLRAADYCVLDRYEDLDDGLYVRAAVTVQTAAGLVEAWAYVRGPNAPTE